MDINRNNYETFFLLYLDGELNNAERTEVENFLDIHADLQKEFGLLQYTIQRPADTIFEPKELLYRREDKRRVFPVYWTRIAAAVMLILAGGWFLVTLLNNHKPASSVNPQTVAADVGKNHPVANSPEKRNQTKQEQTPDANPSEEKIAQADMKKNPESSVHDTNKDLPENTHAKKINTPVNNKNSRHPQLPADTDLQTQNAMGDAVIVMQKSNITPELQNSGNRNAEVVPGQLAGKGKMTSLSIAVTGGNHMTEIENEQATDLHTDNAISVIALNDQNKGIESFLKKLTKRMPGNETAENTKKLRVSVFQFSY